jgi:hypothetical protein
MTRVVHARFDGKAFYPDEPMPIPPDTPVILTVETREVEETEEPGEKQHTQPVAVKGEPYSSLKFAMSLNLEGPADWSENLDEYLYRGKKLPDE